jgi:hypothetical protein
MPESKCRALSSISGKISRRFCGRQRGKVDLKSGIVTRPGQTSGVGVPSSLVETGVRIGRVGGETGEDGPKGFEDLINLRVAWDQGHAGLGTKGTR